MSLEVQAGGKTYRVGKLDALLQFHVMRRLAPVLPKLAAMQGNDLAAALEPIAQGVAGMTDADSEYIIKTCLSVAERKQPGGGWAALTVNGAMMFEDLDMAAMLTLVWHVLQHNLSGFFADLPLVSSAGGQTLTPAG